MAINTFVRALATSALVAVAAPALAQDQTGSNIDPAAEVMTGAVAQMALAQQLYAHGAAQGDALSVLAAARLAAGVQLADGARESERAPNDDAAATAADPDAPDAAPADAATMLALARELAGEDEALLSLIEDAEVEGSRGRIGGALRHLSRLPGGFNDTFRIPFYGGVPAELAVVGDGRSNLDLLLTDENGNTICFDVSYSDKIYCSWMPRWNGYFYVKVINHGRARNSYYLLTN